MPVDLPTLRRLSDYTDIERTTKMYTATSLHVELQIIGADVDLYTIRMAARHGELGEPSKVGRRHLFSIQDGLNFLNSKVKVSA